jgi:hypothetical protein
MQTETGNVPVARIRIKILKLLIRFESATMVVVTPKIKDEHRGKVVICSCCGAQLAGRSFGDTTRSGKARCCDATRKGLSGISAIVRQTDRKYIAHAVTLLVSINAVTIR